MRQQLTSNRRRWSNGRANDDVGALDQSMTLHWIINNMLDGATMLDRWRVFLRQCCYDDWMTTRMRTLLGLFDARRGDARQLKVRLGFHFDFFLFMTRHLTSRASHRWYGMRRQKWPALGRLTCMRWPAIGVGSDALPQRSLTLRWHLKVPPQPVFSNLATNVTVLCPHWKARD